MQLHSVIALEALIAEREETLHYKQLYIQKLEKAFSAVLSSVQTEIINVQKFK